MNELFALECAMQHADDLRAIQEEMTEEDRAPAAIPARVIPILRERPDPTFNITSLDKDELQNVMGSMQAMASAQLRRFNAAGVLVLVFDKSGTAVQVFERPEHDAITDDYARAAVAQLCGIEVGRKAKRKR